MNKKLEDYRDNEAFKEYNQPFGMPKDPVDGEYAYKTGFNLAIALELPVKFAKWLTFKYDFLSIPNQSDKDYLKCTKLREKIYDSVGHYPSTKELYTYWIENVFKINE